MMHNARQRTKTNCNRSPEQIRWPKNRVIKQTKVYFHFQKKKLLPDTGWFSKKTSTTDRQTTLIYAWEDICIRITHYNNHQHVFLLYVCLLNNLMRTFDYWKQQLNFVSLHMIRFLVIQYIYSICCQQYWSHTFSAAHLKRLWSCSI